VTHRDEERGAPIWSGLPSTARELLTATEWGALQHAYGNAEDTPPYLCQLLNEDPEVQAEALGMLDMSVLHQGSLYSSTPPAALFVAAIRTHPQTLAEHESFFPWDDRTRPLRAALLDWLGQIADSASCGEDPGSEDEYGDEYDGEDEDKLEAIHACRSIRRELYDAVEPFLDDPHPDTREAALGAVTLLLKAPSFGCVLLAEVSDAGLARAHGVAERRRGDALGACLSNWLPAVGVHPDVHRDAFTGFSSAV
jgi:hypothetical protein